MDDKNCVHNFYTYTRSTMYHWQDSFAQRSLTGSFDKTYGSFDTWQEDNKQDDCHENENECILGNIGSSMGICGNISSSSVIEDNYEHVDG